MKSKRAFEIQFNWIFVLIAGAAILLFFTAVVVKQRSISETSAKATVLKSVEAIIAGASVSTDTTNLITIPDSNIKISCERIALDDVSRQYQNLILFAPQSVKGNKIITQTLAFSLPYRSSNLLYMTSPRVRYIIIGKSGLVTEINNSLSSQILKENYSAYEPSKIRDLNDLKVRFIFVNVPMPLDVPNSLAKMADGDVTAIKISGDDKKGAIEFFQKDSKNSNNWKPAGNSFYVTKQSLIGAIYSDSIDLYECGMKNVFARHKLVTQIYKGKTAELVIAKPTCANTYNQAASSLSAIESKSTKFFDRGLDIANIDEISSAAESLSDKNKELQKFSCPLIY